jgi:hypothetical protein
LIKIKKKQKTWMVQPCLPVTLKNIPIFMPVILNYSR